MEPPKAPPVEAVASGSKRGQLDTGSSRTSKIPRVNTRHGTPICSCNHGCRYCCSRQSTAASNYGNFLKSGLPRRIMFYSSGEWSDFPETVTLSLIEAFGSKKSAVEVSMNGIPYLFDFLSMLLINLRTGAQRSISWIDEADKCFFPLFFSEEEAPPSKGHNMAQLDLEVPASRFHLAGEGAHCEPMGMQPEVVKEVVVENGTLVGERQSVSVKTLCSQLARLDRSSEEFISVMGSFLSGMGNFATSGNVVGIYRHTPKTSSALARLEVFKQQVRHIEGGHGYANIRNGWLSTSRGGVRGILLHGIGKGAKLSEGAAYGTGIYVTPENRSFASVKHCDIDENGLQHMVLCRVILGNMEKVPAGSTQSSPATPEFGCGVDDLLSPKCYVVWKTHLNTYIHPEYFVTFRLSPAVRGYLSELKDIGSNGNNTVPDNKQDMSTVHPVGYGQRDVGGPTSPWMSFSMLFEAIQNSIPPIAKELLDLHLEELQARMITRDDLIQKTRLIIGDTLLISTLKTFQQNPSSYPNYIENDSSGATG